MITPDIQIISVERGYVIDYIDARGLRQKRYCGNRTVLVEAVFVAAGEVRGTMFPPITEEIDISAPKRRASDA